MIRNGKKEEILVHRQVDAVNDRIQEINLRLGYRSPLFMLDCLEFRKGKYNTGHRQSLTSVLFPDGVHPLDIVCEKWLYQIIKSVSDVQQSQNGTE